VRRSFHRSETAEAVVGELAETAPAMEIFACAEPQKRQVDRRCKKQAEQCVLLKAMVWLIFTIFSPWEPILEQLWSAIFITKHEVSGFY